MKMDGRIVGPMILILGGTEFPEVVHVSPIYDDMLLKFDFLLKDRVNIKLEISWRSFTVRSRQLKKRVHLK